MELTNTKLTLQLINDKNKVGKKNRGVCSRFLPWFLQFGSFLCWSVRCVCCSSSTVSRETWRGWRLTSWSLWSLVSRSQTCSSRSPPLSRKSPTGGLISAQDFDFEFILTGNNAEKHLCINRQKVPSVVDLNPCFVTELPCWFGCQVLVHRQSSLSSKKSKRNIWWQTSVLLHFTTTANIFQIFICKIVTWICCPASGN